MVIGLRCDDGEELGTSSIRGHSTLEDWICPSPIQTGCLATAVLELGGLGMTASILPLPGKEPWDGAGDTWPDV